MTSPALAPTRTYAGVNWSPSPSEASSSRFSSVVPPNAARIARPLLPCDENVYVPAAGAVQRYHTVWKTEEGAVEAIGSLTSTLAGVLSPLADPLAPPIVCALAQSSFAGRVAGGGIVPGPQLSANGPKPSLSTSSRYTVPAVAFHVTSHVLGSTAAELVDTPSSSARFEPM